jgi:hypothetical protein
VSWRRDPTAWDTLGFADRYQLGVSMSAIAHALSRTFRSAAEYDDLTQIALFSGAGLLVTLLCLSYGLDLSPGFFWAKPGRRGDRGAGTIGPPLIGIQANSRIKLQYLLTGKAW